MNISPSDSALTYEERSESPWPTEEYRKVNSNAVVAKSLICLVLMLPTIATIRLLYERVDFECTPNNVTGVYHDTAAEDECGLKLVIAILSQLLLLPFLPETVLSSTVLAKLTLGTCSKIGQYIVNAYSLSFSLYYLHCTIAFST